MNDDVDLSLEEAAETLQGMAETLADLGRALSAAGPTATAYDWRFACDRAMQLLEAIRAVSIEMRIPWDVWIALAASIVASVAHSVRSAAKEKRDGGVDRGDDLKDPAGGGGEQGGEERRAGPSLDP